MSPLSVNHNLMARGVSRQLSAHYDSLADSVRRLSTGLRVERAADDAAGLAIRELMRADIKALGQGARNANDAISMIQTADGALQIIDEKLIRMKELAEQAATGTYDSTQRLMIDSEFQQMASEIDRIAKATDFNGVKLLDGSLSGRHDGSGRGSEDGLSSTGALKVHFGTANDSAEDYYYVDIGDCTLAGLGLREGGVRGTAGLDWIDEAVIDFTKKTIVLDIPARYAGGHNTSMEGIDYYRLPIGMKNITITSNAAGPKPVHKAHVCLFSRDGTQLTGPPVPEELGFTTTSTRWRTVVNDNGLEKNLFSTMWWNSYTVHNICEPGIKDGIFDENATYSNNTQYKTSSVINYNGITGRIVAGQNEIGSVSGGYFSQKTTDEIIAIDEITSELVFLIGGHVNPQDGCNLYSLRIEAEINDQFIQQYFGGGDARAGNGDIISIKTQELAQQALSRLDNAIVRKDEIRAHLGATQNRLENTVTNLNVQAESLQAAESRISDVDVATEMTTFVRSQVLTQSATSMLAQANAFPHMLLQLLQG